MSINERIKEIRKDFNLSQKELADLIGMSQRAISWSEKNGNNVPDSTIKSISVSLDINENYLRYGTLPKKNEPDTFSLDKFINDRGGTELEKEIIKMYFDMEPDIRKPVIDHFKNEFFKSVVNKEKDYHTKYEDYSGEPEKKYPLADIPEEDIS